MTKNMIETTADGSIVLPTYSHATDGWKFTEAKDGILIFQPENKMLGMEFNIFIGWNDPHPHAELNQASSLTFTEAENLYDVADAVDYYHAWLKDCADAFSWIQTIDAVLGKDTLPMRSLRHRDTPEIPAESDGDEADTLPFVWADAGMECSDSADGKVFEFTGGVGVPDANACAVTRQNYIVNAEGRTKNVTCSFELQSDPLPLDRAYPAAAAIALAAAGIEMNAPTPSADEVNALARLLHGFALDTFVKGEALHDRVHA